MKSGRVDVWIVGIWIITVGWLSVGSVSAKPAIHIAFHWHMHQPIYWPYEDVVQTIQQNRYSFFNMGQVFSDRSGPYMGWPANAVQSAIQGGLPHCGAQVSFSGSLIENLNNLEAAKMGFTGWASSWKNSRSWKTTLGNARLDLVAFGYHHPLLALTDPMSTEIQIKLHALALQKSMGVQSPPVGMFPPENAFSVRMIPALVKAGIQWVMVDNIHFDRAHVSYPYVKPSNLIPPNPADQRNQHPTSWVQLRDIWAPSQVAAPFGYRPYFVEYVEPGSGQVFRIIAVPTARYEGNEDGRGGFGALHYEKVLGQYEAQNTEDQRPMLVVLHHDGDNYGGGSDSYYHSNFQRFVQWVSSNGSRFTCTTIADYLQKYPPASTDVIHVEDGSWSGADNGDAEFAKWNGDPDKTGYSPDRNSWAVITAARNRVLHAQALEPYQSLDNILAGSGSDTEKAWHYFLNGEASDYWYWDNSQGGIWDNQPTRAANQAVQYADKVIQKQTNTDKTGPSIYVPQREPYNPGGIEWDAAQPMSSDFTIWTYVYDVSDLKRVVLRYRVTPGQQVPQKANKVYQGSGWQELSMKRTPARPQTTLKPTWIADLFDAEIKGVKDSLVDYYVEAEDTKGNVSRSAILHVYVGKAQGNSSNDLWSPAQPCSQDAITITTDKAGELHWGVNQWQLPHQDYWPANTKPYQDNKAVDTPLQGPNAQQKYTVTIGPFNKSTQVVTEINFVFRYPDGGWSKPDQRIVISQDCTTSEPQQEPPLQESVGPELAPSDKDAATQPEPQPELPGQHESPIEHKIAEPETTPTPPEPQTETSPDTNTTPGGCSCEAGTGWGWVGWFLLLGWLGGYLRRPGTIPFRR